MKKITTLLLLTIPSISFADNVDDIRWIAQDYPPFSYVDSQGNNAGTAISQAGEIMKKISSSKSTKDIEVHGFSRFFVGMNNDKNTVFFPLADLPERESNFTFVGPLFMDKAVVIGKVNITINDPKELKSYKIIGRDGYPGVKQLSDLDINRAKSSDSDKESMMNLMNNNVDLVVCNEDSGFYWMNELGMNQQEYKVVYRLKETKMSFAFNKDTDPALLDKVTAALKK
ncbi:MAG: transporter substrate-binding domain-containing protein [Schleiferiaceae bacterium]|jgi:ABC-type amino acid transport substrate-binding protein|nr:transporter substrate-binding domain-containing protein [Schleiferiaceae bacterium]